MHTLVKNEIVGSEHRLRYAVPDGWEGLERFPSQLHLVAIYVPCFRIALIVRFFGPSASAFNEQIDTNDLLASELIYDFT